MSPAARNVLLVVAALVVAGAGFVLLRPDDDEQAAVRSTTAPAPVTTAAPAPTTTSTAPKTTATTNTPQIDVIRTVNGAPLGGPAEVKVKKGETVRIDVTSNVDDEVHVHGYDIEATAAAGRRARLRFPATIEGRFEIEFHGSGETIGELTVNP